MPQLVERPDGHRLRPYPNGEEGYGCDKCGVPYEWLCHGHFHMVADGIQVTSDTCYLRTTRIPVVGQPARHYSQEWYWIRRNRIKFALWCALLIKVLYTLLF